MVRPVRPWPDPPLDIKQHIEQTISDDYSMKEEVTLNQADIFRAIKLLIKEELGREMVDGGGILYSNSAIKDSLNRFSAKIPLKPVKKTPYRD